MAQKISKDVVRVIEGLEEGLHLAEHGVSIMEQSKDCSNKVIMTGKEMQKLSQDVNKFTAVSVTECEKVLNQVTSIVAINDKASLSLKGIAVSTEEQLLAMEEVTAAIGSLGENLWRL